MNGRSRFFAMFSVVVSATVVSAQAPNPEWNSRPALVTLYTRDAFTKPNIDAIVHRTPGTANRYVIGIRRAAVSPELLSAVLKAVTDGSVSRAAKPGKRVDLYFRSNAQHRPVDPAERNALTSLADRLATASTRQVAGIGKASAIDLEVQEKTTK